MSVLVAGALVFVSAAAVLMLEILSLRLVAPYAGITLTVSTAVIGFSLGAIAVGAWLGGFAADRWDPRKLLGPVIIAAGGLMLLVVPVVRATGEAISGTDDGAVLTTAAVTVFFPASLLWSVSPMVVKTQLGSLSRTGSVVGVRRHPRLRHGGRRDASARAGDPCAATGSRSRSVTVARAFARRPTTVATSSSWKPSVASPCPGI